MSECKSCIWFEGDNKEIENFVHYCFACNAREDIASEIRELKQVFGAFDAMKYCLFCAWICRKRASEQIDIGLHEKATVRHNEWHEKAVEYIRFHAQLKNEGFD